MNEALQSLREARGELSAEGKWLREEFSPSRVAHRAVDKHTKGLLATTFAVGVVVAWLIFHKRAKPSPRPIRNDYHYKIEREEPARPGLLAALATTALPLAFKFATSKPILAKLLGYLNTKREARPARHTVA